MRDRLTELIKESSQYISEQDFLIKRIADHLLENGVVAPPCKVGDKVYVFNDIIFMDECDECEHFRVGGFGDPHECARTRSPFKHTDCIEIEEGVATQRAIYLWLAYGDFGKTVFLSREEAEAALKGASDEQRKAD